jgi:hypothetical protein
MKCSKRVNVDYLCNGQYEVRECKNKSFKDGLCKRHQPEKANYGHIAKSANKIIEKYITILKSCGYTVSKKENV